MSMKYAIGLFGIHYQPTLQHWMPNWVFNVDYRNVIDNNKKFLYQDKDISFYSSTYFSETLADLITEFKFKKLYLNAFINEKESHIPNRWLKRNLRLKETIKLILDDGIAYDYVILTRFDLVYKISVFDYQMMDDKINVICKSQFAKENDLADDNFYLLKFELLQKFYDDLCNKVPKDAYSHTYNRYIDNFNYLIDDSFYSHNIPIYFIDRGIKTEFH